MAHIRSIVTIPTVTIPKVGYDFTGLSYDHDTGSITINYDVTALNAGNNKLFKHAQGSVVIGPERAGETHIAAFLAAGKTLIETELPTTFPAT